MVNTVPVVARSVIVRLRIPYLPFISLFQALSRFPKSRQLSIFPLTLLSMFRHNGSFF